MLGPVLGGISILIVAGCLAWCVGRLLDMNRK